MTYTDLADLSTGLPAERDPPSKRTTIQCEITHGEASTTFVFYLPTQKVTVPVPQRLDEGKCARVIRLFIENLRPHADAGAAEEVPVHPLSTTAPCGVE